MLKDAVLRPEISLSCFQSREEVYLASFLWRGKELHTFGRKCGQGGVFLMKIAEDKCIGFITFSLTPDQRALTMNTGGTTGKYRNMGYGIPLLDSFYSLLFVMGVEEMKITSGIDNPFVLMLIHNRYGFGPEQGRPENAMIIGNPSDGEVNRFPIHFLGDSARQRIAYESEEALPDPFGPSYREVKQIEQMPPENCVVFVGEHYGIQDRHQLYRRILSFMPDLYHHPDTARSKKRIVWKSHTLMEAQSLVAARDNS